MKLSWEKIVEKIEKLEDEQDMRVKIPETFGGGVAIIKLNPKQQIKGIKKYVLNIRKGEENAVQASPYWSSNKPKDLAKWVADRLCDLIG